MVAQSRTCPTLTVPDLQSSSSHADQLAEHQDQLRQAKARNNSLSQENAALKAEVEKLRRDASTYATQRIPPPTSPMPNGALESSDPETAQKLEFAKLAQRFRILHENFRKARTALERRKEERDAWKKRFEMLREQVQAAESEHGFEIASRASAALDALQPVATSFACSFTSTADPIPEPVDNREPEREPEPEPEPEPELPPIVPNSSTPSRTSGPVLGPLDSTQGESEGNELPSLPTTDPPSDAAVKKEPSSDPVVMTERPVKKRRSDAGAAESTPAPRVKMEPEDASSPVVGDARAAFSQESVDLGHITHMTTPRKPRSEPVSTARLPAIYRIPPAPSSMTATTPAAKYVRSDLQAPQTVRPSMYSSALTPTSVNVRMVRSGGDKPARLSRKRQLDQGIADIADDGMGFEGQENTPIRRPQGSNPGPKNRLEQLLYEPETDDGPALTRPRLARKGSNITTADLNIPQRRELPFDKQARQGRPMLPPPSTAQPSPRSPQRSPQRPKPQGQGQLRKKPLRELRLDDFRINPAANEGHDFAFSDVVRDRDDRACLQGCTDMHCCGKQFRALALSQRPDPPLTPAQRIEERTLLERYLGDHAYRLSTMDPEERSELWVQAKTQELANKYGKHRHRYSRMQSPPGFWDADFPSTQELEANRAEADDRERRAIRDRYREATRPGGRWVFRDE